MHNRRDYWELVESIWQKVSIYDGPKIFLDQFHAAPVASRTLFAAHWCQSEVRNGGFHQFFENSTGVLAPEAIAAYEALCMPNTAASVRSAVLWFGPAYPRERGIRNRLLNEGKGEDAEGLSPFDRWDDEFLEQIERENGGFVQAANQYGWAHGGSVRIAASSKLASG